MLIRVLVASEKPATAARIVRLLRAQGVETLRAPAGPGLWQQLRTEDVDLIVVSRGALPTPSSEFVQAVRTLPDRPEVVVVSDREDAEDRARLLAAGCMAVLHLGVADAPLAQTFGALLARLREGAIGRLKAERPDERASLSDFACESAAMRHFMNVARKVVSTDTALLILGETGTGKERLARAIHAESHRAGGPFVAVNCAALPESLLESELFGHERGAFTGAVRARRGYFELAHGGTLFLDEIGDVPLHLQAKLLRVLEEKRIVRVGGERHIQVDVRVMAATNRDLEAAVAEERFREDLYYRLAVVTLTLPPLRERREDIPALALSYLDHFRAVLGRAVEGIRPEAMAALVRYDWPGNVRELVNVMERAVLLCSSSEIGLEDLPQRVANSGAHEPSRDRGLVLGAGFDKQWLGRPWPAARAHWLAVLERMYLERLLRETQGRIGESARRAGVTPRALYAMMRRHGLRKEDFRVG